MNIHRSPLSLGLPASMPGIWTPAFPFIVGLPVADAAGVELVPLSDCEKEAQSTMRMAVGSNGLHPFQKR